MMWAADNDGSPVFGEFTDEFVWTCDRGWLKSTPHGYGILMLHSPAETEPPTKLSHNWWCGMLVRPELDFGPCRRDSYRNFRTGGTGWPFGDLNRYHVLSNGEIDYDMVYTASIGSVDPIWLEPPPEVAEVIPVWGSVYPLNVLSTGPFDIPPGAEVKVPVALVGAEHLHIDPDNIENLPYSPQKFYENMDFSDLIENATWAKWIYDNPGVDTDGDTYSGEFVVCDGDTVYLTGDGVPDWRGALPPPAPAFWLEPIANGLHIRFNGARSATAVDIFSGMVDFEGYRVYCGLDQREASMSTIASYDREDYDKYVWTLIPDIMNTYTNEEDSKFIVYDSPFTLDSLRCLYGSGDDPCADSTFDPLDYTISSPYWLGEYGDSLFYFTPHDYNACEFGVITPIRRVYPDEPYPVSLNPDSVPPEALTEEGYPKYFEYEFIIENLLPTIPYWVNVTAFDFGAPGLRLRALESSVSVGAKSAYPLSPSQVSSQNQKVYIWPNPYRIDGDYRELGFEGRMEEDRPDHRVRAVHFGNLPPRCTIYIYSLDGDLVRQLDHDMDPFDVNSSYDTWNLITRNTQMVVSGLYYWVVESNDGSTQMGKLVIIM